MKTSLITSYLLEELEDFPSDDKLTFSSEPLWVSALKSLGFIQCFDDDEEDSMAEAGISFRKEYRWIGTKGWYFKLKCVVGYNEIGSEDAAVGMHKYEPPLYGQFECYGPAIAECTAPFEFKGSDLNRIRSVLKTFETICQKIDKLLAQTPKLLSRESGWIILSDLASKEVKKTQKKGMLESQEDLEDFPANDELDLQPKPMWHTYAEHAGFTYTADEHDSEVATRNVRTELNFNYVNVKCTITPDNGETRSLTYNPELAASYFVTSRRLPEPEIAGTILFKESETGTYAKLVKIQDDFLALMVEFYRVNPRASGEWTFRAAISRLRDLATAEGLRYDDNI